MTQILPSPLQAPNLQGERFIRHGFFTRQGGCSTGLYESLNVGLTKGDPIVNALENRTRIASFFRTDLHHTCFLKQVHGNIAHIVDAPYDSQSPLEGDALITQTPGLVLSVMTADCLPLLLHDPKSHTIAAVHGGWRGLKTGIIQSTLEKMQSVGANPTDVVAALGPAIAQKSYEVGPEVYQEFTDKNEYYQTFFKPSSRPNHYLFDLAEYTHEQLKTLGVRDISQLGEDTYSKPDLFFSCRRATHKGEPSFGNQASCIMLL